MAGKNVVISISLFADRREWKLIIGKGLNNFFLELEAIIGPHDHFIQFNRLGGFNIRISVLCEGNQSLVAEQAKRFFLKFFQDSKLENTPLSQSDDHLFLNIAQNTIKFGLYSPVFYRAKTDLENLKVKMLISELLKDYFGSNGVDDDAVFHLSLFMELSLICSFSRWKPGIQQRLLDFYGMTDVSHPADLRLSELFDENRESFMSIYQSASARDSQDIFKSSENVFQEFIQVPLKQDINNAFPNFIARRRGVHLAVDNTPIMQNTVRFIIKCLLNDKSNAPQD